MVPIIDHLAMALRYGLTAKGINLDRPPQTGIRRLGEFPPPINKGADYHTPSRNLKTKKIGALAESRSIETRLDDVTALQLKNKREKTMTVEHRTLKEVSKS